MKPTEEGMAKFGYVLRLTDGKDPKKAWEDLPPLEGINRLRKSNKGIESVLTIVGGKIVYAVQEFQNLDPAPLPVLPDWSPIKVYGGYGAPLDIRKAARAGVPMPQHQHNAECHHHGCATV